MFKKFPKLNKKKMNMIMQFFVLFLILINDDINATKKGML